MLPKLQDQAKGRWPDILAKLGVPPKHLTARQGPCPVCGGKDRFRFDDKEGRGTFFCNQCGAGDGAKLLELVNGWSFAETAKRVREIVGECEVRAKREPNGTDKRKWNAALWKSGVPVSPVDPAGDYLRARGIALPVSDQLRYVAGCVYTDLETGKPAGQLPAMIARVVGPNGRAVRIHRTYLGDCAKADIPSPRRMMPGDDDLTGAAVRLGHFSDKLGVAEGIETALKAGQRFGLPVWATLSSSGLQTFVWPKGLRELHIFGDNDLKFGGQAAAYALAHRAACSADAPRVIVHIPDRAGTDWADEEPLARAA